MTKTAIITGATSGIGKACAERFAKEGYNVIITGRRENRLSEMKEQLESDFGIQVLPMCFDVQKREAVERAIGAIPDKWQKIDVLVNNAGLALGLNPIHEGQFDDWDTMIDTNIKGLLYMSNLVSKLMIKNGHGHIIHIGSIAGREAYPNGNVYCATKHAVDGLTKAMRIDLMKHNIRVTQIAPGAVETEFSEVRFKGDTTRAEKVYEGYQPLTGKDIADAVYYASSLPEHVNINDLLIMPMAQANATTFNRNR
ncbi:MAG: SDR family oxidoreductase [Bacteroidetes bacterium]|nr:SDR family oxidoreductase [Bacteroidota bacterium]